MMLEHTIEETKNSLKCLVMEPDFCEKQIDCDNCPLIVPCYSQADTIADALQYIERLEDLAEKQNEEIKKIQNILDHVTHDSKELVARINAGDVVRTCEYCKKNFGDCNYNCLNDFEWAVDRYTKGEQCEWRNYSCRMR